MNNTCGILYIPRIYFWHKRCLINDATQRIRKYNLRLHTFYTTILAQWIECTHIEYYLATELIASFKHVFFNAESDMSFSGTNVFRIKVFQIYERQIWCEIYPNSNSFEQNLEAAPHKTAFV